jgi:EmrB/QacA subfamily drug resistance transporter
MAAPPRSPWTVFSAVAVGTFMATLDGSIVNVALPTLGIELNARIDRLEWIVAAYLLTLSVTLLVAGRLGDLFGHRRVYAAGLVLFTAGSGLCGAAPSLGLLVAARVVQALGASLTMAVGPAIVTATFPAQLRGRALGSIGSVVSVGLTVGPPLGGAIVQALSWRWIFLVNLPIGLLGTLWALRVLPPSAPVKGARFDGPGALLLGAALGCGIYALDTLPDPAVQTTPLLLAAAAAAALLALRIRGAPEPILDGALLRAPGVGSGLLAGLLSYAAMFSSTLLTPFLLARVFALPPGGVGAFLVAVPIAMAISAPVAGWIADRFGGRALPAAGMAALALALHGLSLVGAGTPLPWVAAALALAGAGMGLFQAPNNSAVMGAIPRPKLGAGGGLLATSRNVGMAIGVAAAGSLFALRAGHGADAASFLPGYALALRAGAAVAVAAGLLSIYTRGVPPRPAGGHLDKGSVPASMAR